MSEMQPLVGDVMSQFILVDPERLSKQIEAVREEQEAMCGYALVLKGTRQTEMIDANNRRVIEVFATFAPAPHEVERDKAEVAELLAERASG
jgi:hypothetical protein